MSEQCPKCGAGVDTLIQPGVTKKLPWHCYLCGSELDGETYRQSDACRIRELEQLVEKVHSALRNFTLSGGDAPKQIRAIYADFDLAMEEKSELRSQAKTLAAENAALRAVLRELPCRLSVRYGRPALADMLADIAAACRERGVELEDGK